MTEGEKGVLSLFVIGVLIVVGKVLAGGEPVIRLEINDRE